MLERNQVRALIEHARQLVDSIELQVAESTDLEREHSQAFSAANRTRLEQIRTEREHSENQALTARQQLLEVISELADHAKACLSEYRRDAAATGSTAHLPQLPERTEPDRIQDCRRYFEDIDRIVEEVTVCVTELRRSRFSGILGELRGVLDRLRRHGRILSAVEQYVDGETYLDLPLPEGEKRLGEELALAREELVRSEEQIRKRERQERLEEARLAVQQLREALQGAASVQDVFTAATAILELGTIDDHRAYWSTVAAAIAEDRVPLNDSLTLRLAQVLERHLEGTDGVDPFRDLDSSTRTRLDDRICRNLAVITELYGFLAAADRSENFISRALEQLCSRLPATSFEMLRRVFEGRRLRIQAVASWARSARKTACMNPGWFAWFAERLELDGRWVEAAVLWRSSDDKGLRSFLCVLIALAERHDGPHFSEGAWVDLISQYADVRRFDIAASVAAVATLVIGERDGFLARDLLESLYPCFAKRIHLHQVISLRAANWPRLLTHMFAEWDSQRVELQACQREVTRLLEGTVNPAGHAARAFYRNIIVPEVQRVYSSTGLDALCDLDLGFLEKLKRTHQKTFNPVAQDQIKRWFQEVGDAARHLREAGRRLGSTASVPRRDLLLNGLRSESGSISGRSGTLGWVYDRAIGLLSNTIEPSAEPASIHVVESTPMHLEALSAVLLRGNPFVDEEDPAIIQSSQLLEAVLTQLENNESYEWRIPAAVNLEKFDLAKSYCDALEPDARESMRSKIDHRLQAVTAELTGLIELARNDLTQLESTEEVELIMLYVDQANEELTSGKIRRCRETIEKLIAECDRVSAEQKEGRRQDLERLAQLLGQAVEDLCRRGSQGSKDALSLLWAATLNVSDGDLHVAKRFAKALGEHLDGQSVDRVLIEEAGRVLFVHQPWERSGVPAEPLPEIVLPERPPVELRELPRLVQLEIESLLKEPSAALSSIPLGATEAAFRTARNERADWEEPLVRMLRERGDRALASGDFLRSTEYYLAATQVAYRASARLVKGIEPACLAAINYGRARLLWLLARSGVNLRQSSPVLRVTGESWTTLARDFLLHRGANEFVDMLHYLLGAAEDLGREFLDLPLAVVPPLRAAIMDVLVEQLGALTPSLKKLLLRVILADEPASDDRPLLQLIDEVAEIASLQGSGRPGAAERKRIRLLEDLDEIAVGEPVRETLLQIVGRTARAEDDVASEQTTAEVALSAVTRIVYLDALERGPVPIHFRLSLSSSSRALRDVVVGLNASHGSLKIPREGRSLETSLRPGEPAELSTYVERSETGRDDLSDLILEITDFALRQSGMLRSGALTSKTKKLTVRVVPFFPHSMRGNPYIVGPAVKEYSLIKGRYEESQKILSVLRGQHQDNVPLVHGNRRIGKTTLLYRLSKDPEVRRYYEPVLVDFEGIVRRTGKPEQLIGRFAAKVHEFLHGTQLGRVTVPVFGDGSDLLDQLQLYLDRLGAACGNKSLLVMLDEIELFLDQLRSKATQNGQMTGANVASDFVQLLRHNMQHNAKVSFILAGTRRLLAFASEVGERLFHLPVPIEVGELNEQDAIALITEPVGNAFEYSTRAREELIELTARQPYLLQAICHEIFSYMLDRKLSVVSTAEVRTVLEERVFNQSTYFDFQVAPLRKSEKRWKVGRVVADLTLEEHGSRIDDIRARAQIYDYADIDQDLEGTLRELVDEGILIEDRRKQYRFRFPIVAQYFVRATQLL